MTPPSLSKSTIEMSTVIAEEKKIPTITPARTSVCTGKPPAPAAMTIHRAAGHEGAGKREHGQPEGFEQPGLEARTPCASATPNAAPLDTPRTEGSASGLRVRP